jgi:predicted nucleic acid-binding protein
VARHRPSALQCPGVPLHRTSVTTAASADLQEIARLFSLHPGELQALQVASQEQANLLLTDDTAARLAARNLGISVHGTMGILLRSIRRAQRNAGEVARILRSLPSVSSLHVKQSLLDEIVRAVEEMR